MKKLFYILASAVVALGAMACNNEFDENTIPTEGQEKVSFVAEIGAMTRVLIGDKVGGKYQISLEADDELTVQLFNDGNLGGNAYTFTSTDGKNFSCEQDGVSELLTGKVYVYKGSVDTFCSMCGIDGIGLSGTGTLSGDEPTIALGVNSPVLMFESESDVTFKSTGAIFSCCENHNYYDPSGSEITITAEEGVRYVAVSGGVQTTFSYSIGGVECKSIDITFEAGKLYNLGTLTKPSEWNIRGGHNEWSTTATPMYLEGNFFVARNVALTEDGFQFNQGEWNKQIGAYQAFGEEVAKTPVGEWYQSQYNNDSYKGNIMVEDVSKKYDIYLLNNEELAYFYIAESGAKPVLNSYSLSGTFNGWSDTPMVATSTYGLFVAEGVELVGYDDMIKVKNANTWDESYGGGITNLQPNKFMSLNGGENITITTTGTYDVYFDYFAKRLYLMTEGGDYTTANEQTENGPSKPVEAGVSVMGGWDGWSSKTALVVEGDYYVAKGITIEAGQGFKFINGDNVYLGGASNTGSWEAFGNSDISLPAGTYDLYVSPTNAVWCAVAAGNDAPELDKKYLILNAKDWNQGGARFQAWCWGGSSADSWVSFAFIDGNYFTGEIKDYKNCKLYRRGPDHQDNQWDNNSWNNSGDLTITNTMCRFTGWSTFEFVDFM